MQIKPILKPLLILFIGVVIGVLASGIITMRHLRLAHQIRTERGFLEQASRLDITSSQQDSIEPILKAFAKANQLRHDSLRVREKRALDEFRDHLKPFLSEKELKSLKQILRLKGPKKKRAKNK
tara:strand:+ start:995 stop:1366 length:372 start_codon:yes stop_codon:yes gene_type:complete